MFLCRRGGGGPQPEQWLLQQESSGDRLHERRSRSQQLEAAEHSRPRRLRAPPTLGPPLFSRCPGPRGQHLQGPPLGVGRVADHPGARRQRWLRVRLGLCGAGPRVDLLLAYSSSLTSANTRYGVRKLFPVNLQAGPQQEEPYCHGSDRKVLRRG